MGSTKVELVKDLLAKLKQKLPKEQADAIALMAIRAEKGYYHDFDTDLPVPKMQLHADLLTVGLEDIDQKMQNGDYDDEAPTPEQEKELMASLLKK